MLVRAHLLSLKTLHLVEYTLKTLHLVEYTLKTLHLVEYLNSQL
jgi:hypothetical protein